MAQKTINEKQKNNHEIITNKHAPIYRKLCLQTKKSKLGKKKLFKKIIKHINKMGVIFSHWNVQKSIKLTTEK